MSEPCERHGWISCLCSGAPDFRVPGYMISEEPIEAIEASVTQGDTANG